jgi:DNA polymerase III subunit chi
MTRVDFYLTRDAGGADKDVTVCKLVHKAYRLGHSVYILTAGPDESAQFDRLLWTFNAGSFIPHGINTGAPDPALPVVIGDGEPPEVSQDVLISLTATVPTFFNRFARLVDIVNPMPEARAQARARFRFYRDQGCSVQTHNL